MRSEPRRVALGRQLSRCPEVITLGVRANLEAYNPEETALIRAAEKIYFPTLLFADALAAMEKDIFPSIHNYRHLGDKIKQTLLFQMQAVPVPKTRFYYGWRQKDRILEEFSFPFVGKLPRGRAMGEGVFLIRNERELQAYRNRTKVAYIQEYLPVERDLRVVIIGKEVALAYWREPAAGEFRTNLARGGRISLDPVPDAPLALALDVARRCGFDHVGLDLCPWGGRFLVLEANMCFGREGFRAFGLDYGETLRRMVEDGAI